MKPYQELTRLGRLRRLRQLAGVALDAYGLNEAHLHPHWRQALAGRMERAARLVACYVARG